MAHWVMKKTKANCAEIAAALGVSEIVAKLLVNRGLKTYEEARLFLNPDISNLPNPFLITDVEKAADALLFAIGNGSKIAVYGDYDVDGVMSAVILLKCLKALSADCIYYVPDREKEGYGLNEQSVADISRQGVKLIIACDNGISALAEADLIYELGMSLIIIDHHEPAYDDEGDLLPQAEAIINPKRSDCPYPFKAMCAAGLCYRFVTALFEKTGKQLPKPNELLIFAMIATVCDIVDLIGDNRIIVDAGLKLIHSVKNPGLLALINLYELKNISTYHIGFIIGPTINASGRLESARIATDLFMTEDVQSAANMAKRLYELNMSRRSMTDNAYKGLLNSVLHTCDKDEKVFVLFDENIHESVAGIVAGRIKERTNHPTIVITKGDCFAKGSARSIDGYNIFDALQEVSYLFIKFGGHAQAAGLTIEYDKIDELRELLNKNCELTDSHFTAKLYIEERLPVDNISFGLLSELDVMRPFGKSNKEPVFAEKAVEFSRIEFIGKEKNIIKLTPAGYRGISAIGFDLCDSFLALAKQRFGTDDKQRLTSINSIKLDIAFTVSKNEFRGETTLQLVLKDIK